MTEELNKYGVTALLPTTILYDFLLQVRQILRTCSSESGVQELELLRVFRTCSKPSTWMVLSYLLEHGAASGRILTYKLPIAKRTVYESLQDLRALGIIQARTTVKPWSKRRRPAVIWALPDSTVEQVLETAKLYGRLTNPLSLRAEDLGHSYIAKMAPGLNQVQAKEIRAFLNDAGVARHEIKDLVNMVAAVLHGEGLKVWK